MKKKLYKRPFIFLMLMWVFVFLSEKNQAQGLSITPTLQCLSSVVTTTGSAIVSSTVAGATSYSWTAISTTTACPATILSSSPNGHMITIAYYCCGPQLFVCNAYNGATFISSVSITSTVSCPPTLAVTGNTTVCIGSSTTFTASGAQSYTWNTGLNSNTLAVSPTNNTSYTVTGAGSNGCLNSHTISTNITNPPVPLFNASLLPNGVVSFSNLTTNTLSSVSYTWGFGNSNFTNSVSPITNYTANGTYTVSLTADNNTGCPAATLTQVIQVSSAPGPSCAASYTYSINQNGNVTFFSTSTGTTATTSFTWSFGNGLSYSGVGSTAAFASQNYLPGTYTVTLFISSLPSCSSSVTSVITVTQATTTCSLQANFIFTVNPNNSVNFISTSTGTTTLSSYTWNYGDNSMGLGSYGTHTYTNSGVYSVSLIVNNNSNPPCIDTQVYLVNICNLVSDYTHTVTSNGLVLFNSSAVSKVYPNTLYEWNFGDGIYSNAADPVHTYNNAGSYVVTLYLNRYTSCADSITQVLNITGIKCSANSVFSFSPSVTSTHGLITPVYPWNVTAALWTWGDGTQDTLLYTSHIYSTSGTYSICLSVTVSCGASSSYCYVFTVNKSADNPSGIYFINTQAPAMSTGIAEEISNADYYTLYPNPNTGHFTVLFLRSGTKPGNIYVYDMFGKTIYSSRNIYAQDTLQEVHLDEAANGLYFIKIVSENKTYTSKFLINR